MLSRNITSLSLLVLLVFFSCKKEDDGNPDPCRNDFDQEAMFTNLADNLIIPAYQAIQVDLDKLNISAASFVDNPTESTLAQVQMDFEAAYLSWQRVAPFEFGPAEEVLLRSNLNNFPVNEEEVEQNISSGSYDFNQPDTYDKGFPALDYLLFGVGDDAAAIIEKYTTHNFANNFQDYLMAVVVDMQTRMASVVTNWATGGYRNSFTRNTGTAAGTSLSLIINNLNQHYELIKRNKIGVPSGILTLGFTNPLEVEALYSGLSIKLAEEALLASRKFYLGNSLSGATGLGLDDLLDHIKAEKDGQFLDQIIQDQYSAALDAIRAVPDPLSVAVDNNKTEVETAYNQTTIQVVNLKTDMPSVLCVAITYVDNPSDSD